MSFVKDLLPIIGLFVLMFLVWVFAGGPNLDATARRDTGEIFSFSMPKFVIPNIRPATLPPSNPLSSDRQSDEDPAMTENGVISPYAKHVSISSVRRSSRGVPEQEYVRIRVDRNLPERIVMTGWRLTSLSTGISTQIGKATQLPLIGRPGNRDNLSVNPGDNLYITSGRSPIGLSFMTNICTGYFEENQNFTPRLARKCPLAANEPTPQHPNRFNDQCLDYIENIGRCQTISGGLPPDMQPICSQFIIREVNYNGCINAHKDDAKFYSGEWRIFQNQSTTLWKQKREIIQLTDREGRVVSTYTY